MDKITEKTLVPVSLVITIIGGVVWLTTLWFRSEANARDIQKVDVGLETLVKEMKTANDGIREELLKIRIEIERLKRP